MVAPPILRNIPADFLTTNHYILGQVKVSNTGMVGLLSDINSRYVEVNDANVARIVKPEKVIDYVPVLWLVKPQITAVCLSKRDYVGSISMIRAGYSHMQVYQVKIITPVYEIEATLEWAGRLEFYALMSEGKTQYIILYDAVITATLFPGLRVETPAMLLNRNYLEAMNVTRSPGP
jgi:hypothetical protein